VMSRFLGRSFRQHQTPVRPYRQITDVPMVGDSWSGRAAFVSVVQAANLWDLDDAAVAGSADRTWDRGVFGERQVGCAIVGGSRNTV
jgi:hypothetical protein